MGPGREAGGSASPRDGSLGRSRTGVEAHTPGAASPDGASGCAPGRAPGCAPGRAPGSGRHPGDEGVASGGSSPRGRVGAVGGSADGQRCSGAGLPGRRAGDDASGRRPAAWEALSTCVTALPCQVEACGAIDTGADERPLAGFGRRARSAGASDGRSPPSVTASRWSSMSSMTRGVRWILLGESARFRAGVGRRSAHCADPTKRASGTPSGALGLCTGGIAPDTVRIEVRVPLDQG